MKTLHTLTPFNKNEFLEMKDCLKPVKRNYRRNDIIMYLDEENEFVAIMISGTAHLSTATFDGTKSIVDYFEQGSIFGRNFSPCTYFDPYVVTAKTKCTVYLVEYSKLITCCQKCCSKHTNLIDRLIATTSQRSQLHTEVLGRRTTRSKLLSYFMHISKEKDSRTFKLPLSLTDLADYIAVDRSAMMREIKKLNDEKIIVSKGSRITLLREIQI